jgi:hypothetical protein
VKGERRETKERERGGKRERGWSQVVARWQKQRMKRERRRQRTTTTTTTTTTTMTIIVNNRPKMNGTTM